MNIYRCRQCGDDFHRLGSERGGFCSKQCFGQSRKKPEHPCAQCGKLTSAQQQFCSRPCASSHVSALAAKKVGFDGAHKTCIRCSAPKDLCDFSPHKLGLGGVRNICKPCASVAVMLSRSSSQTESHRRSARKYARSPGGSAKRVAYNRKAAQADPVLYLLARARGRAKKKGLPFLLTRADVLIPDTCPILGVPLTVATGQFRGARVGGAPDSMSLDRIDNSKGYVPGNVAVISWRANALKGSATLQELECIVEWLKAKLHSADTGITGNSAIVSPSDSEKHTV